MQNREPILLYGADLSLRVGLFWAMFLPLANRFSVDRLLGRVRPPANRSYLSFAGIAFIAQIGAIYAGGALMKTGRTWQIDRTAVAYALALDAYARPLGHWLGQYDGLTRLLTVSTLYLELYGPILFILPVFSKWGRLLAIILFAGLQIGFGLCMTMGVFGAVMITLTLALLPAIFWDRFAEPWGRKLASRCRGIATAFRATALSDWLRRWIDRQREKNAIAFAPAPPLAARSLRFLRAIARESVLAISLLTMILWNIGNIPGEPWCLPPVAGDLVFNIGLNQMWDMFAPDPTPDDGWFVVAGTLRNGQTVDLMSGQSPVSFDKPANVAASYQSQIWMAYLTGYLTDDPPNPEFFARYLQTTWNEKHAPDQQLQSIEITAMEQTVLPGRAKSAVHREVIWEQWF
jgi:hypothetical protein